MHGRVAVVTDSTASLPQDLAQQWGVGVVPIQIRLGDWSDAETRVPKEGLLNALRNGAAVTTSPPDPGAFFWAYQDAAAHGADTIISAHISARQSETFAHAKEAAAQTQIPVHVVDSKTSGMSLGYAVLAAARVAGAGGHVGRVMETLTRRLAGSSEMIYVDTLEYLRRGGRIGAAAKFLGTALSMKPLLTMKEGEVAPLERVLGTDRAVRKLLEHAVRTAGDRQVDLAVEHFGAPRRAHVVLEDLKGRVPNLSEVTVTEVSAALAIHLGPGALGVTISPA
ncbi:DegV family protein with EDD domain [Herbihabitans rhizosphaerae]|uniref:DegV family protein with EDD domain n=1 Tax=Herbihabitans rhizosphaerae TaxID=1872711 RepID=A0A4Q7KR58_9PSEU|nr:DegV family protein [Herbihabitans rhizosphaerae]RZS39035.1 DegV family protein with EDD domain [Herbihabitans rhizosphaerae]